MNMKQITTKLLILTLAVFIALALFISFRTAALWLISLIGLLLFFKIVNSIVGDKQSVEKRAVIVYVIVLVVIFIANKVSSQYFDVKQMALLNLSAITIPYLHFKFSSEK